MKIVIIEDEPFAQFELKRLLDLCDIEVEVMGWLDSIEESVQWFREHDAPELIFMDIQLADGASFEIFKRVEITAPVIFTTAYDEYAIQAFKVNSVDYLLKPIELADLQASLRKYESLKQQYRQEQIAFTQAQIERLLVARHSPYKTRFVSKLGDHLKSISIEEVAYFYADDKLVFLVTTDNKELPIDSTLNDVAEKVDPEQFYRINRTYLTRITAITQVVKQFDGRLKVALTPPAKEQIFVSRQKSAEFRQWLDS